eukprot:5790885-Lingulodinium_polyedra.AAC.1
MVVTLRARLGQAEARACVAAARWPGGHIKQPRGPTGLPPTETEPSVPHSGIYPARGQTAPWTEV